MRHYKYVQVFKIKYNIIMLNVCMGEISAEKWKLWGENNTKWKS